MLQPYSDEKGPDPELSLKERRAMKSIEKWRKMHIGRMVFGAAAWVGGLVAFSYGV